MSTLRHLARDKAIRRAHVQMGTPMTPPTTDLPTLATYALTQVDTTSDVPVLMQAAKAVREQAGCTLPEAVEAVRVAMEMGVVRASELPATLTVSADDLPDFSVVATGPDVYIKRPDVDCMRPWLTTNGHIYLNHYSDAEDDELLADGATVLRVGAGESS